MRIILSRKGFDSGIGGIPSPILPNGEMLSLPIPETATYPTKQRCRYSDVRFRGEALDQIISRLGGPRRTVPEFAHLDPDLCRESLDRSPEWRAAYGQALAAESHLIGEGVGPGDLFLFFGWFRQVDADWRYIKGAAGRHVIFGWLQVDHKVAVAKKSPPLAVAHHPHFVGLPYGAQDAVYVSRERLNVSGVDADLPGAGLFPRVTPALILTAPASSRSVWDLPSAFADANGRVRLSYHRNRVATPATPGRIRFPSVARGQEFVVKREGETDLRQWLKDVFSHDAT